MPGDDGFRQPAIPESGRESGRDAGDQPQSPAPVAAGIALQFFHLADLPDILRLEREAFGEHAFDAPTFLYYAAVDRQGFLVARAGRELVGYVVARRVELRRGLGEISSVAVAPAYRRQGLGTRLLEAGLAYLRQRGVRVVRLQVAPENAAARLLYQRLGFRPSRDLPHYYGPGHHGLEMEKVLEG